MARQEDTPNIIAFALDSLARLALLERDNAKAKVLLTECAQIRRQIGHRIALANVLVGLSQICLQEGDPIQVKALLEESLAIYKELKIVRDQVYCLVGFAGIAYLVGRDERAALLFGAAEAALEMLHIELDEMDHLTYDPIMAAVREWLGQDRFDAAWTQGRKMTLEHALELVQQ
jgi:hypothetical protein